MATFQYNGEGSTHGTGITWGPCIKIRLKLKDGTIEEFTPVAPATEFVVGQDIGYTITDQRCIRHLQNDPKFTQLT